MVKHASQLTFADYGSLTLGWPLPVPRSRRRVAKRIERPAPFHVLRVKGAYVVGWHHGAYVTTARMSEAMRFRTVAEARAWQRARRRSVYEFWLTPSGVVGLWNRHIEGWPVAEEPYEPDPRYPPLTAKERASQAAWMRGKQALEREQAKRRKGGLI